MWLLELCEVDINTLRGISARSDVEVFRAKEGSQVMVLSLEDNPVIGVERKSRELQILFADGKYGPEGGLYLFHVGLWVPSDFRDEFLAWYRVEHLPILLENPSWDGCRFAEEKINEGCQFHALHQLVTPEALDSLERRHSRATPWFKRLARYKWFDGSFTRELLIRSNP